MKRTCLSLVLTAAVLPLASIAGAVPALPEDDSAGDPGQEGVAAPPPPAVTLPFNTLPSGGVLFGDLAECPGCEPGESLSIRSADGTPIEGTFEILQDLPQYINPFVFRPSEPFQPGSYLAEMLGIWSSTIYFEVVEASVEAPTVTATLTERASGEGDRVQCEEVSSTGYPASYFEQTLVSGVLNLEFIDPEFSQYSLRIVSGDTPTVNVLRSNYRLELGSEPEPSCVQVIGTPFDGGDDVIFHDECHDAFAEFETGVHDEPFGDLSELLIDCTVPPDAYVDDWCGLFASGIASQSCDAFDEESCLAARRTCPGGDLPFIDPEEPHFPYEEGSDPRQETDGGTMGTGDSDTSANGGSNNAEVQGGCSLGPVGLGGSSGVLWFASLLTGLTLRLRRRNR